MAVQRVRTEVGWVGDVRSPAAGRIVVGIDGSEGSLRALEWAVAHARTTGSVLEIVCCWVFPATVSPYGLPPSPTDYEDVTSKIMQDAVAMVSGAAPEVRVEPHIENKAPALALVAASKGADLLVMGSRGLGGFTSLLLGSVSQYCTHHAHCPVLVVPSPPTHGVPGGA